MKKRVIYSGIVLMGFAIICLLIFQVYWYKKSYKLKEELFSQSVNSALNDVVNVIGMREAKRTLGSNQSFIQYYFLDTLEQNSLRKDYENLVHQKYSDTVFGKGSVQKLAPKNQSNTDTLKVSKASTRHISSKSYVIEVGLGDSIDINEFLSKLNERRIPNESIEVESSIEISRSFKPKALKHYSHNNNNNEFKLDSAIARNKVIEVLDKLTLELAQGIFPISKILPNDTLYLLLKNAFEQKGIQTNFLFALKIDSNQITTLDSLKKVDYSIRLFPYNTHRKQAQLQIYFPDKNQFINLNTYSNLIVSLLFTIFMLSVFFYNIYIVLKQKKIAEIKNDFINNMTHEFKTPIATIALATDTIVNQSTLNDKQKLLQYVEIIRTENKRMNNHVEQLLHQALTEKENFKMPFYVISVQKLIEDAVLQFEIQLQNENRLLKIDFQAKTDSILADSFHLRNAIANLVDNAIKYSPIGSPILIQVKNEETNKIIIKIIDEGIGIESEYKEKVFERFFRIQTGNIHPVKGFGVGLSYTKNIVSKHNGTIEIDSTYKKGSAFIIKLPTIT